MKVYFAGYKRQQRPAWPQNRRVEHLTALPSGQQHPVRQQTAACQLDRQGAASVGPRRGGGQVIATRRRVAGTN